MTRVVQKFVKKYGNLIQLKFLLKKGKNITKLYKMMVSVSDSLSLLFPTKLLTYAHLTIKTADTAV